MRSRSLVGTCVIAAICAVGTSAQSRKTERVVLVTLDGARWQEVFAGLDESLLRAVTPKDVDITATPAYRRFWAATAEARREKLMPFLWHTLAHDGAIAGNRTHGSTVTVSNRYRFSYPGYSELLTGQAHDDVIRSNDAIRNPFPSVLQFARHKLALPASKVATFASWGVFSSIVENTAGDTTVNAGLQPYDSPSDVVKNLSLLQYEAPLPWDNMRHDAFTFAFAMDYLKRQQPTLLLVAFDEMDDWAHDGKYDLVLDAIHRADHCLEVLWTALQGDPFYRGRTTLIVTADHGRGRTSETWQRHGQSVDGADEVWLAIASPDLATRGEWKPAAAFGQNQIAGTIAALLGLDYREQNPEAGAPLPLSIPRSK
jgi:phosphopentomutase/2,3-bisphosphoglycerate-independent phosphoglycerate mutase family metalloenzyme